MKKKILVLYIVMPYSLVAFDSDATELLPKRSMLTSIREKSPTITLTDDHKRAMHNAGTILTELCTTFGNVVGRLLLMGFFTHKSFNNLCRLLNEEAYRPQHAAKAIGYCVAVLLLGQDGYAWLLKQNNTYNLASFSSDSLEPEKINMSPSCIT